MQAIVTAYHGPTNTRPSRIYARCQAGRLSVPYDDGKDVDGNHMAAAQALAKRLDWHTLEWATGTLPNGDYCHVQARNHERWLITPGS